MACPYFVPQEILNDGSWLHPARLPLGAGWNGRCCASPDETTPSDSAIREYCNLGNATTCPNLPPAREWDAIRFSIAQAGADQIILCYVCERAYAPIEHGKLVFDLPAQEWRNPHSDARVRRLATSYLQAWQTRQRSAAA